FLPRGGNGDVTVDLSFAQGQVVKAHGNVHAGGLVFDALGSALAGTAAVGRRAVDGAASNAGPVIAPVRPNLLVLDRVSGNWKATRLGTGWRVRVDSLDLAKGARFASLTLDTSESSQPESPGHWIRGNLEQAPLESVLAVTRWLAPHFDLAGIQLDGTARNLTFDWASGRGEGNRLRTSAQLDDVALTPRSRDFVLGGLSARVSGSESALTIDVQSRTARLELTQSQQKPLADVHVSSTLRVSSSHDGWKIETDEFLLEHQRASLNLSGSLQDDPTEPRISATGTLTGADIPLVARLLGDNTAEAFGAAASRLTAGRIQNAEFALRGPVSDLPFEGRHDGFTGSLTLRDAIISGGELWPDANGIDAHVEWRGAQIQATIEAGHAGPFQLASAKAQWGADGRSATRLTGHVNGRLEDAIAWVHGHPQLQEYAPDVGEIDAKGDASFDFNVSVPPETPEVLEAGARGAVAAGDARGGGDGRGIPDVRRVRGVTGARQPQLVARVSTFLDGATVQAVSGLPPLEGVTGSFVFDAGRLQRSTLTGSWLGGPVTLHVGERREKSTRVLAVQAQGTLNAQQLATLANATGTVDGSTDWSGELAYLQSDNSQAPRWRMRADSNLLGVVSSLPEPFAKRSAAVVPVHLEVTGANDSAQLRANVGDRMRSLLALKRKPDMGWAVDRGAVRFGTAVPTLPLEPVVLVRGRVSQLDLPAYAIAWQRLRQDSLPTIRAQMVADEMLVGGRRYDEVSLQAERTDAGTNLLLDSAAVAGIVRWPTPERRARRQGLPSEAQPAEIHFTRLSLPDGTLPSDGIGLIAALAPTASLAVDELNWRGRSLGRLTATVASQGKVVSVDDARLVNSTHDAHGVLRCQTMMPVCRLTFMVDSTDAAATLTDFGFTPDLTATAASLNGDVEWHPVAEQPWLASLQGTLSMRLADGTLRPVGQKDGGQRSGDGRTGDASARDTGAEGATGNVSAAQTAQTARASERSGERDTRRTREANVGPGAHDATAVSGAHEATVGPFAALTDVGSGLVGGNVDGHADGTNFGDAVSAGGGAAAGADMWGLPTGPVALADDANRRPFALLAVPALVSGLDAPGAAGASLTKEQQPLHFAHLEADFELHDGQATTSNLHFDGDAEILMRGRIGIVSRDYDQQVWLLRGEERLPAAVRRFGATPRVAAAWLSLRDLFGGGGAQDRSRAVLRLQGTWDDPMVVTAN
ncbi:MAG TPA: AsmA-like C-terminal region-containing protein, partial [Steroidobacteraceae bacterium]|nr:AsmA-like C-terminal region-containing protein [Steroidobacteraceae bacterium]